jgi:hypothetical protein
MLPPKLEVAFSTVPIEFRLNQQTLAMGSVIVTKAVF